VALAIGIGLSGCYDDEIAALNGRIDTLQARHDSTRQRLQAVLVWINQKSPPDVGLYEWIDSVHKKLWPNQQPSDPVKPAPPPPPF
jgi:hypothetical protein